MKETWYGLTINGRIDGLWPSRKDLLDNFDSFGLFEAKDLAKGPVTIAITPVKVTVGGDGKVRARKRGRPKTVALKVERRP